MPCNERLRERRGRKWRWFSRILSSIKSENTCRSRGRGTGVEEDNLLSTFNAVCPIGRGRNGDLGGQSSHGGRGQRKKDMGKKAFQRTRTAG